MSATRRMWLVIASVTLTLLAVVQSFDIVRWATAPWTGLTLLDGGRITARTIADVPESLRSALGAQSLRATAVAVRGQWVELTAAEDAPSFATREAPRAAGRRLAEALRDLDPGDTIELKVSYPDGTSSVAPLTLRPLPARIVFERCGLFAGIGLLIAAVGLGVVWARPNLPQAHAFSLFAGSFGVELLTAQVTGGYVSRFHWLSIAMCYVAPPAAAVLGLAFEPRAWLEKRPFARTLPWAAAVVAVMWSALHGDLLDDASRSIGLLRAAGWAFFAFYVVWLRLTATRRQEARRLEFYLAGMAAAFAPPTMAYALPHATSPSPWVMLSLLLLPLSMGYGILRHRLFDIEVVLRRGTAGVLLMVGAAALFAALVGLASGVAGDLSRSPTWVAGLAALAMLGGGALRPRLQRLVDRGLNPERFRYLEALRHAGEALAGMRDRDAVARLLVEVATGPANLRSAAVYLRERDGFRLASRAGSEGAEQGTILSASEPLLSLASLVGSAIDRHDFESNPKLAPVRESCLQRMDAMGADLIFPLTSGSALLGLFALGPRRDDDPLNAEDLRYLRALADRAAFALSLAAPEAETYPTRSEISPVPLVTGAELGRYRIEREVGRGGMSTVYLAMDTKLDRAVALKFVNASGPSVDIVRLRREAKLLANLSHPAIMQIHALEEAGGHNFLVAEFLEGGTLHDELSTRGRIPAAETHAIARVVADALAHAADLEILHRDVKPLNLMRDRNGRVKLTDFGLAKPLTSDSGITATGRVVGTLMFLAPELTFGEPASVQSDMYAFGLTIYALLQGLGGLKELQRGGGGALTRSQRARESLEPGFDRLIARALEPEPGDRHLAWAEVLAELDSFLPPSEPMPVART